MVQILVLGLSQLLVSVILFGSNFVPVKKYNSGDGFYAQWIMSVAIMFVGFCVHASQNFVYFYPMAMLGGVFWSLGNILAIPIIKRLGLALGLLIWNATSTLFGWVIGTWGGFGIHARPASMMWLSYLGMVLIFVGGIMFMFVKNKPPYENEDVTYKVYEESDGHFKKVPIDTADVESVIENSEWKGSLDLDKNVSCLKKSDKAVGVIMALIAGIFFGLNLLPIIEVQDNEELYPNAPKDGLPYVFSQCVGAFITSSAAFFIYALVRRNNAEINPKVTIPALISGLLWGTGETLLINATSELSPAITYPISAKLPGCVAAIWSIFYFKEIEKGKNLAFLIFAILITLVGAACIGISK